MFEKIVTDNSDECGNVFATQPNKHSTNGELVVASLVGFAESGSPLINHAELEGDEGIAAITTTTLAPEHIGRQVVLMHVNGDPFQPVVMGLIRSQLEELLDNFQRESRDEPQSVRQPESELAAPKKPGKKQVQKKGEYVEELEAHFFGGGAIESCSDGKRVEIKAEDEIVLSCGESSITLSKSGRITIKGTHLVNRSSGVNRVLGGTVQIN